MSLICHRDHTRLKTPTYLLTKYLRKAMQQSHNLRKRAHNLTVPSDVTLTAQQNFIPRMLFVYIGLLISII